MSFNGSGTFVINTAGQPVVPNTVISATAFNALTNDLANGLSTCITKDGQTTPTANIPMGNNKITGLAPGTSGTDAANLSQVQGSTAKLLQSVTGTDTITAAMVPALTAYAAGQMFYFVAAGDNTGAVTINIDSLGAKSVTRDGSVALVAGDILSGEIALVVYDGTRFQLLNGNSFTNLNVSNNLTLSASTANGVLYLNGSKVATSGSALTFDGTNLAVGASPGFYGAQVATAGSISITGGNLLKLWNTGGTGVGGISSPGTDTIAFGLGASFTEGMRLTSTGLGIGTSSPSYKLDVRGGVIAAGNGTIVGGISYSTRPEIGAISNHPVGFITNNTTQMLLDTSGNLGIGTASPVTNLHVYKTTAATSGVQISNANWGSTLTDGMFVGVDNNNSYVYTYENIPLVFGTNNTERGRFTAGGYFKASNAGTYEGATGGYHELRVTGADTNWILLASNTTTTAANCFGQRIAYTGAAPNGTGNRFLACEDSAVTRAEIRSNGGIGNYQANDVNLSDERTKKDIAPLGSMWAKFKALEIVTFKYKDQTHDDDNIGLIAQQVEAVAPEFVDVDGWGETPEDGVPLKSIYTADMYHAAIKALQEAMARIELLEADMAALKGAK